MANLSSPISELNRVGQTISTRLHRLGIKTAQDLLYHFPHRHEDWRDCKKISDLQIGEAATIKGTITEIKAGQSLKKRLRFTKVILTDQDFNTIELIWFNQPYLAKTLKLDQEIFVSGKVTGTLFDLKMSNPVFEKDTGENLHTSRLVPIYSTTGNLSQKQLRFLVQQIIKSIPLPQDHLPVSLQKKYNLLPLDQSLKQIHLPESNILLEAATKRLAIEEMLGLLWENQEIKNQQSTHQALPVIFQELATRTVADHLPFTLTNSQKRATWQIFLDLAKNTPMNRLLEGDVGCGKTVVAALVLLNIALNKQQACLLAPTEILTKQHFQTLAEVLTGQNLTLGILTANVHQIINLKNNLTEKTSKKELLKKIEAGEIDILIATHAVLQNKVNFKKLNLVIIDEQHRFGVEQRQTLRNKGQKDNFLPHLLSMSATPIPRTLALTLYGNLELSIINELPPNRKNPITKLIPEPARIQAYQEIKNQLQLGRQAYVICPLIEDSKTTEKKAVEKVIKDLANIFPGIKIDFLHGKMSSQEKEATMIKFASGQIKILVATTVVEVGVNVPNANIILIENAENFGLAQLHQLRGRVNRASYQAYCFLLPGKMNELSFKRLKILEKTFDGFALAEADLKLRGYGSLHGAKQSGYFSNLKLADFSNQDMVQTAKKLFFDLLNTLSSKQMTEIYQRKTVFHQE